MKGIINFLLFILLFSGCASQLDEIENTQQSNFDFVWHTLNEKFSLFDVNDIRDWNLIYQEYENEISDNISDDSLHNVLNRMVLELKDRHSSIASPFQYQREFFPGNIDEQVVQNNYLSNAITEGGMQYSLQRDNVSYLYIESFRDFIGIDNVRTLIADISSTNGLVIDIRGNQGGSEENALTLAQALYDEKRFVKTSFTKNGPDRDDFIEFYRSEVSPWDFDTFTKPIVLLVDQNTYSASSDMVLMMRVLPHVTIMGDRTGGGHGTPVMEQMPNGWILRYSSSYVLDPNGVNVENGIDPDQFVLLDNNLAAQGVDSVIETAIDFLK